MQRFLAMAAAKFGLRAEVFLQQKTASGMATVFVTNARRFSPMTGWIHPPGAGLRPMPSREEVEELAASGKRVDTQRMMPEYCYWFLKKAAAEQRALFGGTGGLITLLIKPDPNTVAPKMPFPEGMLKTFGNLVPVKELEALLTSAFSMKEGFLAKSKPIFGKGLEDQATFKAIPFIIPKLSAHEFFTHEADCASWFDVFDVYIGESVPDQGILLASKPDLEEDLITLLAEMRKQGHAYAED